MGIVHIMKNPIEVYCMRTLHIIPKSTLSDAFCGLGYREIVNDPKHGLLYFENLDALYLVLDQNYYELCNSCFNLPEVQMELLAHVEL